MKISYISAIMCTLAAVLIWNLCGISAEAGEKEDILKSIYEQIVTEQNNSATVKYNSDTPTIDEIQLYFNEKDNPDNLYDGKVACERGHYHTDRTNDTFNLEIQGGYNVSEADELINSMVKTVNEKLEDNASDREKMAAICDYIAETFSYDYGLGHAINNKKASKYSNFVEAYYGNRKILCGDYAQITYLMAKKMGIDCEMFYGKDHVFNIVKFKDADYYTGYDLTSGIRYAQIPLILYITNGIYHPEWSRTARSDTSVSIAMNNGLTYKCAGIKDIMMDYMYFAFKAHHAPELVILMLIICMTALAVIRKLRFICHKRYNIPKTWKEA